MKTKIRELNILAKIIKTITLTLIIILSVFSADASIISGLYPDFEFESEYDNAYAVSAYNGSAGEVYIPETLYDRPIKRFSKKAFYKNAAVSSLYMHDNMTVVNKWAFRDCPKLSYVYFSKKTAALWDFAFAQNPELRCALIRNTEINTLYQSAFYKCSSLEYVSLPVTLKTIGVSAFEKTSVKSVVIPENVTSVKNRAFADNRSLREVYIPEGVQKFGEEIFNGSENVKIYVIANSPAENYCAENDLNYEVIEKAEFPSNLSGDVNNDGKLSIRDVTTMQMNLARIDCGFLSRNCDFNADCDFNIKDVTAVQRKALDR